MTTDIFLKRVPLATTTDLGQAISQECVIQANRDKPRRLVSVFESHGQLVLVFERFDQT